MRKLIISILSIVMICSCAFAGQWSDGCSPENPYGIDKPADFSKNIGWMLFDPLPGSTADYDVHSLSIYLPRADVEKGSAVAYIHKADGTPVAEIRLSDANYTQYALDEELLAQLSWGEGSVFTIELGTILPTDTTYVVQVTEGFVVDSERNVASAAIAGNEKWTFTTAPAGENRLENMFVYRGSIKEPEQETTADAPTEALTEEEEAAADTEPVELALTVPEDALAPGAVYHVGDTVHFIVRMGEGINACLVVEEGDLEASETWFEDDQEVEITFTQKGLLQWDMMWMDDSGTVIDTDYFEYIIE